MKLKLTRKLAQALDGVDLSNVSPGDLMDVAPYAARVLLAEGWAVPVEDVAARKSSRDRADERPRRGPGRRPPGRRRSEAGQ